MQAKAVILFYKVCNVKWEKVSNSEKCFINSTYIEKNICYSFLISYLFYTHNVDKLNPFFNAKYYTFVSIKKGSNWSCYLLNNFFHQIFINEANTYHSKSSEIYDNQNYYSSKSQKNKVI